MDEQKSDNSTTAVSGNADKTGTDTESPVEEQSLHGMQLVVVVVSVYASTMLMALELGIVATAIPNITDTFHRLDDVGWYACATYGTAGVFSPVWTTLYKHVALRPVYLATIVVYLVASIVAATATNSPAVIVGRALQGLGGAGTISGSLIVLHHAAPPVLQPILIGAWMAVFMLSTILGPILGGALTTGLSWRWCFWINLPLGGALFVLLALSLHLPRHVKPYPIRLGGLLAHLDLPGCALLLASLVCLTLGLEAGGQSLPWNSGPVLAELVLAGVLAIAFVACEYVQGDRAMVPLRLLRSRMTAGSALFCLIVNSCLYVILFYFPIYLQAIEGQSAMASGVHMLPMLAFFAAGSMLSGFLVGKTRLLQPFEFAGALLTTAGAAIFSLLDIGSSKGLYVGAQVLLGTGMGLGYQIPLTSVQAFSAQEDIASTTGIIVLIQAGAGGYIIPVAQSLFGNFLLHRLQETAPQIDASAVLGTGASDIHRIFAGDDLDGVLAAYVAGIKDVFRLALASAVGMVVVSWAIPLKRLPRPARPPRPAREEEDTADRMQAAV